MLANAQPSQGSSHKWSFAGARSPVGPEDPAAPACFAQLVLTQQRKSPRCDGAGRGEAVEQIQPGLIIPNGERKGRTPLGGRHPASARRACQARGASRSRRTGPCGLRRPPSRPTPLHRVPRRHPAPTMIWLYVAAAAAGLRPVGAYRTPAVYRVEPGTGVGQAPPPGPGRARRPRQVGLVAVRNRLGEHTSNETGDLAGPNPVDRGKKGSKIHLITERTGLPLSIRISAANMHDSQGLQPRVRGIPPIRSRRGPRRRRPAKLHADKGCDYEHLRRRLRCRHRRIESSRRLGCHRWTVERTVAWLAGCRRLHRRYEGKAAHFLAFAGIAATLICYRRLVAWPKAVPRLR